MIRSFKDNQKTFSNLAIQPPSNGWTGTNSVITGDAISTIITGNGTALNPGANNAQTAAIVGHKYYVRVKASVTNSVCATMRLSYGGVAFTFATSPTINTVYDVSTVITATSTSDVLYLYHYYADSATANGKVMTATGSIIIDLTVAYGAGSEPTSATMDLIRPMWALNYYGGDGTYTASLCINDFTSNGDKVIEPKTCVEYLQDNEDWRIELTADLSYQPYLLQDYILVVPTKENGEQPFRVNNIKVDNYEVSLTARHVGFDLENYICSFPFGYTWTTGLVFQIRRILTFSLPHPPFSYSSDNTVSGRMIYKGSTLLDNMYELVKTLGGHLTFNWWNIDISSTIGTDRGVTVEYGKNLQGAEITEDWNEVCTQIYPIGNNKLTLGTTTNMLYASGVSYDRPYTRKVTFQTDSVTDLETYALAYLEVNKVPKLNYKVKADTVQEVRLGDTIKIYSKQFTISTNVLGYKYNVLSQRIEYVEFGNFRRDLKTAFNAITADIADLKKSVIQENITMNDSLGLGILAYKSTSTTVNAVGTSGGITKYVLDSSEHNTDSTIFEITGGSVKVKKAGLYLVTAMVSITSGTSGKRINSLVSVNGGTARSLSSIGQVASDACRATGTIVLNLNANDTLDLSIYNSDTASKTSAAGVDFNYLCITKQ